MRMAVPPPSGARTGTVAVPRALLFVLSGLLVATLLAVAFLIGRDAGRAETAAADLLAEAPPASVEPAPSRPTGARPRTRPEPPARVEPDPASASPRPTRAPPEPTPALAPPAEPAVDPRERAAVARYFEEVAEISGSTAGVGDPETMAMALLSQATGGDWSQFDELGDTQRSMARRLGRLRVPPVCREYHQKMVALLGAGATLLDTVKQGIESGSLGALGTLTTTAQRLQVDAEEARRLAAAVQQRFGI